MGKGRELEAVIRISGDIDKSIKKALDNVTNNLDAMEAAARKANGPIGELAGKIQDQSDVLEVAKRKYAGYVLAGEKGSDQAKDLKKKIQQLSGELQDNKAKMAAAEKAADNLTGGLDDMGDAARDSGDGFTVMKGAMADLVSSGIQNVVDKAIEGAQAIYGLAESTREYREDMGKLETAWESAGKSTDLATDTYKNFYSVLGEEDRSVEAVNHLAKFVNSEQDMQKWTDICTGVWGTFGDSLPIEGLTEASNETAKVGKITGVLADALNWAGVNEEKFQESLDSCNSESERAKLITETLNGLYSEAADNYRENNESIIEARKAQSDYTDTLATIGETIEPVTTAVTSGFDQILEKALELIGDVDMEAFTAKIDGAFDVLTEDIMPKVVDGFQWVIDNKDILIAAISGIAAGFAAFKTIGAITGVIDKVSQAGGVVKALGGALSFLTSPITWVVVAIGALVAAGVWLYQNWDMVKAKALELGAKIGAIWSNLSAGVTNFIANIGAKFPILAGYLSGVWSSIQAVAGNIKGVFTGIIDFISNVFAGNWSGAWQSIVDVFGNLFGGLVNLAKAPINGVVGAINAVINGINGVGFTIPDWVPVVGGKTFSINLPNIPTFAKGGFTDGVSIAGEAGTEAIISFDPRYRDENLSYWARAGRMLGADFSDFALTGSGGGDYYDLGGVTFAPQITVHGEANKQTIMEAIEAEYPEFLDMLDEYFAGRRATVYG